ncbi:dachshund homolog 1-like [Thamnophis elegans]|uniref:dachshund homolog 1-like n=1 Tax=Thamnophis elegans TaxID=35005 RepID=UPI001376CB5F|nr:dachshund homolog 1-like [Thamnophis elegans]
MAVSSPPSIPATSNPGGGGGGGGGGGATGGGCSSGGGGGSSSSSNSSAGGSAGLFRADPLYAPSPSESPRLAAGGGGGGSSGGGASSLIHGFLSNAAPAGGGGGLGVPGSAAAAAAAPLVGNECKMVDLHGVKVASFVVDGQELICLPQVFDLFLKHLVGGLHTVYTKLKRLDIAPVVCTVEQVRILRGLGAIQPGVNRCKLITRKDFETLYSDCTNAR